MNTFQVDEETFNDIHASNESGDDSSKICADFGIRLPAVKIALKYDDFAEYEAHFEPKEDEDDESGEEGQKEELLPSVKIPKSTDVVIRIDKKELVKVEVQLIRNVGATLHLLTKRSRLLEEQIAEREEYLDKILEPFIANAEKLTQ